jgi:beta-lactamase regulating signal transducer with metallopeptidase domain
MTSLAMNSFGVAAVWGIAQVSAVALLAILCYALVRRRGPAARSHVAATSLGVTLLVAALAISPWPRWFSVSANHEILAATSEASSGEIGQAETAQSSASAAGELATEPGTPKKSPNTIDVAATFWQTMLRELSTTPVADADHWAFSWPAAVALGLGIAVMVGALRLALGLWGVRQLRRSSRPIADRELLAEVDRLRRAMNCAQTIELRSSSRLSSPVTVGWRRALVILPADWDGWNEAELRTALAHELAHIVRGDYAAGVLAQFCVAANYYHPLVHWLARRLRLEQELAADAVAATVIGSRGEYLLTLAQLALRCDDRPVAWAARPFLPGRGALSRRIEMLRDAGQVFARPLSGTSRAAIVAMLLCVGIFAAGVRGPEDRGGLATAAEPPGKPQLTVSLNTTLKTPFDLSQIPRDSQVVLALRPARLFKQNALKPIAQMINTMGEFKENFGFPIETVEYAIIATNGLADQRPLQDMPGLMTSVLHTKTPIDETKLRLRSPARGKPEVEEIAGRKLYLGFERQDVGYFFLNETTLVTGDTDRLRAWLKDGKKKNWAPAGWDEFAQADAAVWMDVKSMRGAMKAASQTPAAAMMGSFSVLWEETDSVIAGGWADDSIKIRAAAKCTSPENAERVQKTLEAAITLATNSVDSLQKFSNGPEKPESGLLTSGVKLMSQVKLSHSETTVEATIEAPLESLKMFAAVAPAVNTAREAARRAQSSNNMKQLALAMHNYQDTYKHFPPAVLIGPDGKTPYSWRVALLPFLDQNELYKQYKLDELWDSENNKKVLAKMPAVFRCPSDDPKSLNAAYFAVVGPQTLFHDNTGTAIRKITDGTSNTIMFVDAKRDIPWTKPEDIAVLADKPLPVLGGWFPGVTLITFADGSVRPVGPLMDQTLRALFTKDGGEVIPPIEPAK